MRSNYVTGRRREYAAKTQLETLGYDVIRSAGSKGLVDLVAWNGEEVRYIQVKYSSNDNWNAEDPNCRKLRDKRVPFWCRKELWLYHKGKGLVEIRDLKLPKPDIRSFEGKQQREKGRQSARELRLRVSEAKARMLAEAS